MPQEDADAVTEARPAPRPRRSVVRKALLLICLVVGAAALLLWFERFRIADTIVTRELARRGIEARYRIDEITPTRHVLSDIVIGDPAAPDLTIERLVVRVSLRLGFPQVSGIGVLDPRLHGSFRDGELSFGALDPLVFGEGEEPFELPDMVLVVRKGRGLIETDHGPIGLALEGSGHLRSGFSARLAASAPALEMGGCALDGTRLSGRLSISAERPRFAGPLRFGRLECDGAGVALAGGEIGLKLGADRAMTGVDGEARLNLGPVAAGGTNLAALSGTADFTWRKGGLTARYDLEGRGFASAPATATALAGEGFLRARQGFARIELEGELTGRGVRPGPAVEDALASAEAGGEGTLAAPLVARLRRELAAQTRSSTLDAEFTARHAGGRTAVSVPRAVLTGTSGAAILILARGQAATGGEGAPASLAGEFATGGAGLPRIAGQVERSGAGGSSIRLAMERYEAGSASIAVPALAVATDSDGALGFMGQVRASGPLPGGAARDLVLPIEGRWSEAAGLALWPECIRIRFNRLELADLALDRDALTLCPPSGSAIVRVPTAGELKVAAGVASLDLAGRIGQTPIAIASGPVGFAWPGTLTARELDVALGPPETASRFAIADLTAELSRDIGGKFAGADIRLNAVPLDLVGASGEWRYADGRLALSEGTFTLEDRREAARFRPLGARDAALALEGNRITAEATLREQRTGAVVTELALRHDLATGAGHADLAVPGVTFGDSLQPTDLTDLALGVVALVEGTVTGSGRIAWDAAGIASTGAFSSDDLDFAAAFGPVEGAAGTVTFTDLIGLTTAPNQRLTIRAFNPGIEVYEGEVTFQLREGSFIDLQGARWPFLGGTLTMRPLTIAIGVAEERGYVLDIEGLEAARFVERMQLENIAATGTLDGTVPILFDADGNGRIEGGYLQSRPPGGNVAYVGELTYAELTPVANFAFDMLRSLDYRQMRIAMDGPLAGELVTRVALEGVSQGADIERNLITRHLAQIPVRLVVNLRAPFYRLIGSLRSLYDPSAVRDPRDLGLVGNRGEVLRRETDDDTVEALDKAREEAAAMNRADRDIQPAESEEVP